MEDNTATMRERIFDLGHTYPPKGTAVKLGTWIREAWVKKTKTGTTVKADAAYKDGKWHDEKQQQVD